MGSDRGAWCNEGRLNKRRSDERSSIYNISRSLSNHINAPSRLTALLATAVHNTDLLGSVFSVVRGPSPILPPIHAPTHHLRFIPMVSARAHTSGRRPGRPRTLGPSYFVSYLCPSASYIRYAHPSIPCHIRYYRPSITGIQSNYVYQAAVTPLNVLGRRGHRVGPWTISRRAVR